MKKLLIVLVAVFVTAGAGAKESGKIQITCNEVEVTGDSIYFRLAMSVSGEAMAKCQGITVYPELVSADGAYKRTAPLLVVNGKNRAKIYNRKKKYGLMEEVPLYEYSIKKRQELQTENTFAVPYEQWMENCRLQVKYVLTSCADQQTVFRTSTVAQVIREVREEPPVTQAVLVAREETVRKVEFSAYLIFKRNEAAIDYYHNGNYTELKKIRDTFDELKKSDADLISIQISGYASPEGSYHTNKRLAEERCESVCLLLRNEYNIPRSMVKTIPVGEDWAGLRKMVSDGQVPFKSDVLALLDSGMDYDLKDQRLRIIGGQSAYNYIVSTYYPKLRRVDFVVRYEVRTEGPAE